MRFIRFEMFCPDHKDWVGIWSIRPNHRPYTIERNLIFMAKEHYNADTDGLKEYRNDNNWRFAFTPYAVFKLEDYMLKLIEDGGDLIRVKVIDCPSHIVVGESNMQIVYKVGETEVDNTEFFKKEEEHKQFKNALTE